MPRILKTIEENQAIAKSSTELKPLCEEPLTDPLKELNDCKQLLKTLTLGLKTVSRLSSTNISVPSKCITIDFVCMLTYCPVSSIGFAPRKKVVWSASNLPVPTPNSQPGVSPAGRQGLMDMGTRQGLLEEECVILTRLLTSVPECFKLYSRDKPAISTVRKDLRIFFRTNLHFSCWPSD